MFREIFAFEFFFHFKGRLFLFAAIVFFALTFLGVVSPNVQFGALGGANLNSPLANVQIHIVMSILSLFVMTAFLTNAVLRDDEHRMAEIIYSTRISKTAYLLGRFAGAFLVGCLAYLAASVSFALASFWPTLDQELIGPFVLTHYIYAYGAIGLPTLFANSAIIFAVAALTRDQRLAYAAVVGLLVLYVVTGALSAQLEFRTLAALLDPSGTAALGAATQYWTVFERNTELVPLDGLLLYNRLIWLGVGAALLFFTRARFRFEVNKRSRKRAKNLAMADSEPSRAILIPDFPRDEPVFDGLTSLRQFWARVGFEIKGVMKSIPFWILMGFAFFITIGSFLNLGNVFGTSVYPVTRVLIGIMAGTVTLALLIVVVFYGAELVWRDREVRFQEILGSTPAPSWTFVASKMVAALAVVAIFLGVTTLVAMGFQLFNGYTKLEPGLYLVAHIFEYGTLFYFAAILSVVLQVILPNKYVGMMIMVVYIIGIIVLPSAGYEDPLYLYGSGITPPYSDMNGFNGFIGYASWYHLYWAFFATVLGIFAYLMWSRGPLESFKIRLKSVAANASRASVATAGLAAVGFAATFGWIYYNTHMLNPYLTIDDQRARSAQYERTYQYLADQAKPRITDVKLDVALYPEEHRFSVEGTNILENRSGVSLSQVTIGFAWPASVDELVLEGAKLSDEDRLFNMFTFELDPPMEAGERRSLSFKTSSEKRGFKHNNNIPNLLLGGGVFRNGTFVNNAAFAPYIGFASGLILTNRVQRRQQDLDPIPRFADLDDKSKSGDSYLSQDSDWINFEATVSTSADQLAIAPGYLIDESEENGRRIFHYKMDEPIQNLYAFLSARYETRHESWNGIDLSVNYQPGHDANIDRMMVSLKKSLAYFSENFSPYQYRQMRVLEFPAYAPFAQSFPNTVPWSEGLGFIADIRDPEDIDYVFYVGAHEVAHQWWGHQVSSANVQGQTVLVETLAQYSALMVMEHEYGPHQMRRFLKYELDNYLTNRGNEAIEEMPLYRVENQQYIHYRKGSIVMYALKDALGEDAINRALKKLIEEVGYQYDPYPTSRDLLRNLRAVAQTEAQQDLITDLFERITLWDLKVEKAEVAEREDGRFDVTLTIEAKKFEADGKGRETERPLEGMIDIGLFSKNPDDVYKGDDHVLYFEKHLITSGRTTLTLTVDRKPEMAGVDPYNKFIDRNSDDNLRTVDEAATS